MKALVTGCAGFVGRHYVEHLKELGWEVYGLDIVEGQDAFDFFNDPDDDHFDLVVHCAYEVGGRAHIDGSNMALSHNVKLDAAMFEWALKTYQGAVLYFSSCAAYPARVQGGDWVGFNHNEDLIGLDQFDDTVLDNYGWAKLTGERVAKQASEQGLRVHIVRPFSGYGEDQSLDYPFPSIVRRVLNGDLSVWGPPGQTRDWIHIDDIVDASYAVYCNDDRRPVNLCTGRATEMGSLALAIDAELGRSHNIAHIQYLDDKPFGSLWRVGDPTRMLEHYEPQVSLQEGIQRAIAQAS